MDGLKDRLLLTDELSTKHSISAGDTALIDSDSGKNILF
jgi:hypothetical protein